MNRKFLEELGLEKDAIDKIMAENGKDIEAAKEGLSSIQEENETLKEQLNDANEQIKSFEDMNIDEIKESVESWKTKAEENEAALKTLKNETSLKDAIRDYNSVDPDVLLKLIDKDSLIFEDKGIKGLEDQIKDLQESKSYLFKDTTEDNRFNVHEPPANTGGDISPMENEIINAFND